MTKIKKVFMWIGIGLAIAGVLFLIIFFGFIRKSNDLFHRERSENNRLRQENNDRLENSRRRHEYYLDILDSLREKQKELFK